MADVWNPFETPETQSVYNPFEGGTYEDAQKLLKRKELEDSVTRLREGQKIGGANPIIGGPSPAQMGVSQGATLKFGDEILAGPLGLIDTLTNHNNVNQPPPKGGNIGDQAKTGFDNFTRNYQSALDWERSQNASAQKDNPVAYGAGEVGGALGLGGAAGAAGRSFLAGARPTVASVMPRAAAEGAVYGAGQGVGSGTDIPSRARGGVEGGVGGAALGAVGGGVGGALANRALRREAPATEDLRNIANRLYGQARAAPGNVNQPEYAAFRQHLDNILQQGYFDAQSVPRATAARRVLDSVDTPSIGDLQKFRDVIGRRMRGTTRGPEGDEERLAFGHIMGELDDWMTGLTPASGISPTDVAFLTEARPIWTQMRKSEAIDNILFNAEGARNEDSYIRSAFQKLRSTPRQWNRFTPDEQRMIEATLMPGPVEAGARYLANPPQALQIARAFGINSGNPLAIASLGGSVLGGRVASGIRANNAETTGALMRNGGQFATPGRAAIAQALSQGGMAAVPIPETTAELMKALGYQPTGASRQ